MSLLLFRDPPLGHEGQTKSPNHPPPVFRNTAGTACPQQNSPNPNSLYLSIYQDAHISHVYSIYTLIIYKKVHTYRMPLRSVRLGVGGVSPLRLPGPLPPVVKGIV